MTAERRRWWRMAAIAAVSGCVITSGWYGLVRAKGPTGKEDGDAAKWTRSVVAPPVAPVAQVERAPATAPVTPASATLPVPPVPIAPALPAVPAIPSVPDPAPLALPPAVDPVAAPKLPDLPAPAPVKPATAAIPPLPSIPPAELPPLPAPPKTPDVKAPDAKPVLPPVPELPVPGVIMPPPLPSTKAEQTKPVPAPLPQPTPVLPEIPAPPGVLPPPHPVQPPTAPQPTPPAKPDSDLNPIKGGNTLNPAAPPVAPFRPLPTGGDKPGGDKTATPGTPVDRAKPTDPSAGSSDKFVFPVPDPIVPPHRDDTMMKITTAASFAILSGAMLAAEKAAALPSIPAAPKVPTPGTLVKADEKTDVEKLKTDLTKANEKIAELEKQVKTLTELLKGRKDDQGPIPTEPGAIAEIARLKDRLKTAEDEIKTLRSQTSLKPGATVPEVKPKGTVKVVNEYPVEISIVVNEKSYRVAPNTKLDVEVPAGEFTYQLLQAGATVTRSTIKEKETVTLRIK